ncbi:lztr1_7 [Blepharisma stoltei]|uniref:Tyrosine-protein kinase ephrin type A/B receptor-like domain-containing protein n=1 Tax=Blepharisma stoltei TaxID=1481888 RepID=A0AAU9JCM6_9CILI|nr:unnamed protein product [Blepharisma stoltei]
MNTIKKNVLILIILEAVSLKINLIPPTGFPPDTKFSSSLVYDPDHNQLFTFGGNSIIKPYTNDLASFDLTQKTWKSIVPYTSTVPDPRQSTALFFDSKNQRILLYGGKTAAGIAGDFWCFNLRLMAWKELEPQGETPGVRANSAYTTFIIDGISYYAIFGGLDISGIDNTLYILNGTSMIWTKLANNGNPPLAQEWSSITYYNNSIYMWGGLNRDGKPFHDTRLFRYDLSSFYWFEISIKGEKPEGRAVHTIYILNNFLYVILGYDWSKGEYYNDIWKVNLNLPEKWIKVPFENSQKVPCGGGYVLINSTVYEFSGTQLTKSVNMMISFDISIEPVAWVTESPNTIGPGARMMHTFCVEQDHLWLFGGINSDQTYLNDFWKFDLSSYKWTQINPSGSIPSPRHSHASSLMLDTILVFGGIDSTGYLNDFYEYLIYANVWKQVVPIDNYYPSPRAGACGAASEVQFFIFGGLTISGLTSELWIFDINTYQFTLLDDGSKDNLQPQMYNKCFIRKIDNVVYFYIASGEGEASYPIGAIQRFNCQSSAWEVVLDEGFGNFSLSRAAVINVENYMILVGGEQWMEGAYDAIYLVDLDNSQSPTELGHLPSPIFSAEIAHFRDRLFLYGGGDSIFGEVQSYKARNSFYEIIFNASDPFTIPCSTGTYLNDCIPCPEGTYSSLLNSAACVPCPVGTFGVSKGCSATEECYPCLFGTFSSEQGSSICKVCPAGMFCPVGTVEPRIRAHSESYSSSQPSLYKPKYEFSDKITLELEIAFGVFIGIICIVAVSFRSVRKHLHKLDLYDDKHDVELYQPIYKKQTSTGGFFSVAFILLSILFAIISILSYSYDNMTESKALAPLVSLVNTYSTFSGDIKIVTTFLYYGGFCTSNNSCVNELSYQIENMKGKFHGPVCETQGADCKISFTCNDCILDTGASAYIILEELNSYSSAISVSVSSTSSIPNESSEVYKLLYPSDISQVFRSHTPSQFTFQMIPSVFLTDSSNWKDGETGYHVSMPVSPVEGVTHKVAEIHVETSLRAKILLNLSDSGLVTSRNYKQSFFALISSLLGAISGLIQAGGFLMGFYEGVCNKIAHKRQRMQELENIKNNREDLHMKMPQISKESIFYLWSLESWRWVISWWPILEECKLVIHWEKQTQLLQHWRALCCVFVLLMLLYL